MSAKPGTPGAWREDARRLRRLNAEITRLHDDGRELEAITLAANANHLARRLGVERGIDRRSDRGSLPCGRDGRLPLVDASLNAESLRARS